MPGLNGLQMLEKIRETDLDVICIVISAHNESEQLNGALTLGVDGYLHKPLNLPALLMSLRKAVKKISLQKERLQRNLLLEREVIAQTNALEKKLYIDDLTGIASRYAFLQQLSQSHGMLDTILLLNIDAFTIYNELYGIEVGNEILIAFARMLENFAAHHRYTCYRVSGDEFALHTVRGDKDPTHVRALIETLLAYVEKNALYIESIGETITVSVTAGIACSGENPLGKADIALKKAKKSSKRYLVYDDSMDNRVDLEKTLYWRKELVSALKEQRVVPFFQPIVDRDGKVVKYEALMRIKQHEANGDVQYISPYAFLDIAIKTRLYDALSMQMLPRAIDLMMDKDVSLSININLSDVYNPEMFTLLREKIVQFNRHNQNLGRNDNHIILEILENDNIQHYHLLTDKLAEFKQVAAKIAIDDFGSGYSNFSHIIGISPQYLKIDASLIKNIDHNRKSYEIVRAIVQFAKSLNIKTIAEFVSSEAIFEVTHALGIDEFQGYYFGQPLPIEEIEATTAADIAL